MYTTFVMYKLLVFLIPALLYANGSIVNSVRCQQTTTCATTWQVTSGNLISIGGWWARSGGGIISDSQQNTYKILRTGHSYLSNDWLVIATASASGILTVKSTATEENIVIAEFSGISTEVEASASNAYSQGALCPPAPLTLTSKVDGLLLGIWAIDAGTLQKCSPYPGTTIASGTCGGGGSGQMTYQLTTAGVQSMQWTVQPVWNGGDTNCGIYQLKSSAPPPPVVPPTPPPVLTTGLAFSVGPLIAGPTLSWTVHGTEHGLNTMQCRTIQVALYVVAAEGVIAPIEADWSVDVKTCDVTVKFAKPQSNFYITLSGSPL